MTWSGIAGVSKSFFEVAKTLGAGERYLVLRVAIPAAFPLIFIGLFVGLGTSFVTLIVAEMLGVKAGLGFYITWAQGWSWSGSKGSRRRHLRDLAQGGEPLPGECEGGRQRRLRLEWAVIGAGYLLRHRPSDAEGNGNDDEEKKRPGSPASCSPRRSRRRPPARRGASGANRPSQAAARRGGSARRPAALPARRPR
ncbi:ABC transporter permease subunit [Cohnella sp. REN36]|nr:ABC transporter permease subunit [Cohnella sp. REN36]